MATDVSITWDEKTKVAVASTRLADGTCLIAHGASLIQAAMELEWLGVLHDLTKGLRFKKS